MTVRRSLVLRVLAWVGLIAGGVWLRSNNFRRVSEIPGPPADRAHRDVVYRYHKSHRARLDIYLPPGQAGGRTESDRYPAVLAIHGGSWVGGSKSIYGPQVARIAQAGFVVFVADYSLARPNEPSWPEVLEDLRSAVRWIRSHADGYRVDPYRIVAVGSGAGGHLAALLGTYPPEYEPEETSSRVQAIVSLYGPSDLEALLRSRTLEYDPVWLLVGRDGSGKVERLRAASPIHHVTPGDAPVLLIHGTEDLWLPAVQSRLFAERLEQAGVKNRLLIVTGARHGFELNIEFPEKRDLLPEILAFLESVWHVQLRP
jgi:acetyl esterase/lipase